MRHVPSARKLLVPAVLAALAATPAAAHGACPGADAAVTADSLRQARQATRCLINAERRDHGLGRVRYQRELQVASRGHSQDMVARRFFAHDTPGGRTLVTRARAAGYVRSGISWAVGENIGWGSGHLSTPKAMMDAWMASEGHRENLLTPHYRHVGIGIAMGSPRGGDGVTYTTDFGSRR